jgi:phosphoserine phosphatase
MDIQAKITNALADFDDLLVQGLSLEAALRIAATENEVSERVLAARASRGMSLEERRQLAVTRARVDRHAASSAQLSSPDASRGYYRKLASGKKVWVDRSQFKFDF